MWAAGFKFLESMLEFILKYQVINYHVPPDENFTGWWFETNRFVEVDCSG